MRAGRMRAAFSRRVLPGNATLEFQGGARRLSTRRRRLCCDGSLSPQLASGGLIDCDICGPRWEKQVPRARKKALGMTKLNGPEAQSTRREAAKAARKPMRLPDDCIAADGLRERPGVREIPRPAGKTRGFGMTP